MISQFVKKLETLFKSPITLNIFRASLLINTLLIKYMSDNIVSLYRHIVMRIIVAILVAILAYIDPMAAVLLSVTFIIGYQEANVRLNVTKNETGTETGTYTAPIDQVSLLNDVLEEEEVINNITNPVIPSVDDANKGIPTMSMSENDVPEDNHPAHSSLTENIQLGDADSRMLQEIQQNVLVASVGGIDPDIPVQTLQGSNDAQGSNFVKGYDNVMSIASRF